MRLRQTTHFVRRSERLDRQSSRATVLSKGGDLKSAATHCVFHGDRHYDVEIVVNAAKSLVGHLFQDELNVRGRRTRDVVTLFLEGDLRPRLPARLDLHTIII